MERPLVTVFTSAVYPDATRIWYACVRRAFPLDEAHIEIFDDSADRSLRVELFPGAVIRRQGPGRRDFEESYNDVLERAATPYLAFIDSDVYWISRDLWGRVKQTLARPEVVAVACVSKHEVKSHATSAVVLKVDAYRRMLGEVPAGFFPAATDMNPDRPPAQWSWFDTGDRITQAMIEAGHDVQLLHLDEGDEIAVFHHISLSRRIAEWLGANGLARVFGKRVFWEGYASNFVLRRLHDRLFPECAPYYFPFGRDFHLEVLTGAPGWILKRSTYVARLLRAARRVERFIRDHEPRGSAAGALLDAAALSSGGRRVLRSGEHYHKQIFGPDTVNRGAVLLECEWNGGLFESGVLFGGVFRAGIFRGGVFWGGVFQGGDWVEGRWENGFDHTGRYRPRGDHPPHA